MKFIAGMFQSLWSPAPPPPPMINWLNIVICISIVQFLFSMYLDFRQLKYIKLDKPPKELNIDQDTYLKSRAYSLDKWRFSLLSDSWSMALNLYVLKRQILPRTWLLAHSLSTRLLTVVATAPPSLATPARFFLSLTAGASRRERLDTITFFIILYLAQLMFNLPLSYYQTFILEAKHGFNKQTHWLFATDLIKSTLLTLVIFAPPLLYGLTAILQRASPFLPLQLGAFLGVFSLLMMFIYPTFIAPLFNRYEPLPEGSLRRAIESLAQSVHFPLKRLFVSDGSKRSSHSNAYMYGFGSNRRIVLYDTLLQQCSEAEVVAVLAHELGHWHHAHVLFLFVMNHVVLLAQLSLYTLMRTRHAEVLQSFGFPTSHRPVLVSLLLFFSLLGPVSEVIGFLAHVLSRRFEYQADAFAVHKGHGKSLVTALLALHKENKSHPHVDPLYSAFHYSHPPIVERLRAIQELEAGGVKKNK